MQEFTAPDISERLSLNNLGHTHGYNSNRWNGSRINASSGSIGFHDAKCEYQIRAENIEDDTGFNYSVTLTHSDGSTDRSEPFEDVACAYVNTVREVVAVMDVFADKPELFSETVERGDDDFTGLLTIHDIVPTTWPKHNNIFHGDWEHGKHDSLGALEYWNKSETMRIQVTGSINTDSNTDSSLPIKVSLYEAHNEQARIEMKNGDSVLEVVNLFAGSTSVFN